jgi:hypothetical protein
MRLTNGRTPRSDTRSAVHDPSAPQGPRPSTPAVQQWPRVMRRDGPCGRLDSGIVRPRHPAPARTRRHPRPPSDPRPPHRSDQRRPAPVFSSASTVLQHH